MPTSSGPNQTGEENLVFAIDTHDTLNGITPLGCGGFNGSTQGIKNLLTGTTYPFVNSVKLTGRNYFTAFAIDYPESSFGGDAAGRDGITPGYNVRSGTKTFDFGRALHYAVYNNLTDTWVKTTRYDSYVGTAAADTFVSEYATAIATYPDATHIVAGSHRDSYHTAAQYVILKDLGAPSNVESIIGFSSPEWILVGKPGLGADNAFGWVFQNHTTDATRVAHLNFGLPIKAKGGIEFDGTNDYVDLGSDSTISPVNQGWTAEYVFKTNSAGTLQHFNSAEADDFNANWLALYNGKLAVWNVSPGYWRYGSTLFNSNQYYHIAFIQDAGGVNMRFYVNGIAEGGDHVGNVWTAAYSALKTRYIGRYEYNGGYSRYFTGEIPVAKLYSRALTTQEVKQNYQQYKTRFNLS